MAAIRTAAGTSLPRLLYGTAWKKDDTADLVYEALRAGFRGVDTAAQPRHYREDLVAAGVRRALADGTVRRADLYLQTKFTPLGGQDPDNLPYDPAAPLAEQVRASVESSLRHFAWEGPASSAEPAYLDCLVLHSPLRARADLAAVWAAMAAFVPHRVRSLGVSNVHLADLQTLVAVADELGAPRPAVVQNRFYRATAHDVAVRQFCGTPTPPLVYQSFWTLTGNRDLLQHPDRCGIAAVAAAAAVSHEVALYALVALGLGGVPQHDGTARTALCPVVLLDGTTTRAHMDADLAGLARVEDWAAGSASAAAAWQAALTAFRRAIGE